jgi:hypothetical protein
MSIGDVLDLSNEDLNLLISERVGQSGSYCSDHKSVSRLEDSIPQKDFLRYRDYLITIVGSRYFIASPRQRAEAYFLTFQNPKPQFKNAKRNKNSKKVNPKIKSEGRKCPTKKASKKPKVNYRKKSPASSRSR